ncbi:MAG: Flp pilus assembly complex ATPase component TadA, partial [Planctomycetes bacterium]|nr:Flp pilus assembly complex ATPase component TadA [Planctomycetota bacterium]
ERVVLRLLDKSARLYKLEELGMDADILRRFEELITLSHGIIFVTGPTGSGKTTTLYAALERLNSVEKNVLTIEDPIEYQLSGISQTQVSTKKGVTFATGLRNILRQDPDVIMVGEVRDSETARMATQSALTGHLVFSTLHTNDSASCVSRMLDLGIEPFLVSSSLLAVLAQRLVRRICPYCKELVEPDPGLLERVGLRREQVLGGRLWRGRGCGECFQSGYRDRVGIYELLVVTEPIRRLIMQRAGASEIKRLALEEGMLSLRMEGARKVLTGVTTPEEILRVTQVDEL